MIRALAATDREAMRRHLVALGRVLLHLCGFALTGYTSGHGETATDDLGEAGSVLQGAAVHGGGDPLGTVLHGSVARTHGALPSSEVT